jgi:hypothetical protein
MISRWTNFLTTDGEKDSRNRDDEFVDNITSMSELMAIWEKGWETFLQTLTSLTEEDLLKEIHIRGERHTVLDAIERQVAHYASHVGQIVYIGKMLKNDQWESLSIPRGQSEKFLNQMLERHQNSKA